MSQTAKEGQSTHKLYVYTIPLKSEDGVVKPTYDTSNIDNKEFVKFSSRSCVVGTKDVNPHLHKDSVNADAESFEVSSQEDIEEVKEMVF